MDTRGSGDQKPHIGQDRRACAFVHRRGWLLWVGMLFLTVACSRQERGLAIEREVLVQVLADVHVAEAMVQEMAVSSRRDSLYDQYYERVFSQRGVTRREFEVTMKSIRRDPDVLYDLYTEVLDELARRDAHLQN